MSRRQCGAGGVHTDDGGNGHLQRHSGVVVSRHEFVSTPQRSIVIASSRRRAYVWSRAHAGNVIGDLALRLPWSWRFVGCCIFVVHEHCNTRANGGRQRRRTCEVDDNREDGRDGRALRCQQERALGRMRAQICARRRKTLHQVPVEGLDTVAIIEAVVQDCCTMGYSVLPQATPRWWMKRRIGGAWEDLRRCDDAVEYFREKLRMSPYVFRAMAIASSVNERPRDAWPMSMSTAVGVDPSSSVLEALDRGRPSAIEDAHVEQEDHHKQNRE
ncbi:hypothetical protein CBR_g49787 [Chara braunii]|uniref:Uncharacterized protein n=1 Tax=Chara braunii TaxID=69332 RepID=A0A388M5S5_CHABU|nr:hypothetical protein CBR_g49787 [Chara braunii]|eukprot:GBG89937.1 hypothetical protein CBR_g49787 [Chara braunii]